MYYGFTLCVFEVSNLDYVRVFDRIDKEKLMKTYTRHSLEFMLFLFHFVHKSNIDAILSREYHSFIMVIVRSVLVNLIIL